MRVVYESTKYKILETHKNYIVKRANDELYNHAHFKRRDHAFKFVHLLEKGIIPRSDYWYIAAKRVLTDEEFEESVLQKTKTRYRNNGKKNVRRR